MSRLFGRILFILFTEQVLQIQVLQIQLFPISYARASTQTASKQNTSVKRTLSVNKTLSVKTIDKQIEDYFKDLKSLSADFAQSTDKDNEIHKAHIWLRRDKKPKVCIKYQSGEIKEMHMNGKFLTVINRKTNKSRTYSILTTPIYAILSGQLELKDLYYQVFGNNNNDVSILIRYNDKQTIIMTFSKLKQNIHNLIAWTISDTKSNIHVGFNSKKYYLNSKIPDSVFVY